MGKTIIAIIGCGTIANSAHIPAYLANLGAEIKYFCDIRKDRAEKAVEQYGLGIAIDDHRVILDDPDVEAVSICTPNNCHASIAIDCLRAGKHVLCEKPAARTYEEALEMQKVQHETGKILNIGVVNRSGPPDFSGTYDVDDYVTALIRTSGPSITVNGAWAQNIGVDEMYIDFLGDKAGIQYGGEFTIYSAKHGALLDSTPKYKQTNHFQNEIDSFLACIKSGDKLASHIDTVILTSKIIQAIYQSSEQGEEISFLKQGVV